MYIYEKKTMKLMGRDDLLKATLKEVFLIFVFLQTISVYGQNVSADEIQYKLLKFEKLYGKEKFERAAPYYEWLMENAKHVHQDFS